MYSDRKQRNNDKEGTGKVSTKSTIEAVNISQGMLKEESIDPGITTNGRRLTEKEKKKKVE